MDGTPVQLIKEKLAVAEVLKGYIELQPAGRNFKGLCPFHREKSPSFMVSPDRGSWHCFGCGEGGDIFTFVMKYENLEFGEALKVLAEKAGVELRRVSPMEYKHFGLLYDINGSARDFYVKTFFETDIATDYIKGRGLTLETTQDFEIGYAPTGNDALARYLMNFGYAPDDIIRAGLAIKSDRGPIFDRFRGRIMFPIWNHAGKVVGFTGRILPQFDTGEIGKYVNSPETAVFQKSKLLYGFSKAKPAIREKGNVLMVEGQMDMIMTWQSGVKNVVATSGTALTTEHLQSLRRLTDRLVLSFDNDNAGYNALERGIDLAESLDFEVKVAVVEGYKDAAEAIQADPKYMARLMEVAKPGPLFYFDRYLSGGAQDMRDREYILKVRKVVGKLLAIPSPVERSAWMQDLSARTGLSQMVLNAEAEKIASENSDEPKKKEEAEAPKQGRNLTRRELLAERLIAAAVNAQSFTLGADVVVYLPEPYPAVWELLSQGKRKADDPQIDAFMNTALLAGEELSPQEFKDLTDQLRREYLKERRYELSLKVKQAEQSGDDNLLRQALQELSALPRL